MKQMMEQAQPPEGDETTITTMSLVVILHKYLSTNSVKSIILRNTGLVVKVISSKPPHEQDLQTQHSDTSAPQTQVQSLKETDCETRT